MAIASGTPVPAVYLLEAEPGINAFAAGLTTNDAVVAVTRGTLEKLTRDELQGVIGHEFSHILNGDMRLNLRIAATVFGILVIGLAGRAMLWSLRHTRVRSDRKNGGGFVIALVAIAAALLIIGYVGYFFGRLIQAAVSRQREFLADASAVQFTRNPAGLSGALKKIGGYALGSKMLSAQSAAVGHIFFSQAFRAGFTGLWSTHPPLDERIRAIDPQFDGKMFEPETVVDIEHESFQVAGFQQGVRPTSADVERAVFGAAAAVPPPSLPPARIPFKPAAAVASIGTLTPQKIASAQQLLGSVPPRLRDAAHDAQQAAVLLCAVLLGDEAAVRAQQRRAVSESLGVDALRLLDEFEPHLRTLDARQKMPIVQVAVASLRQLSPTEIDAVLGALDELIHSDAHVSTFEFALQKLVARSLQLSGHPTGTPPRLHSFRALRQEIAIVLSALARTATNDPDHARVAFHAGASQFALLPELQLLPPAATSLVALDQALDQLDAAIPAIKQRTLLAAAHVVGADDQVNVAEAELLRAISAALDCPMPLIGA